MVVPDNTNDQVPPDSAGDTSEKTFDILPQDEWSKLAPKEREEYLAKEEAEIHKLLGDDATDESSEEASEDTSNESDESSDTDDKSDDSAKSDSKTEQQTAMEQKIAQLERSYKELQAEFTRKSQRLADYERKAETSDSEATTGADKELEQELSQFKKENPKAARLLEAMNQKIARDLIKPLEEKVSVRERIVNQRIIDDEVKSFKTGPLASMASEAFAILDEAPAYFNRLLNDGGSIVRELEKELYARYPEKVALLRLRWEQKNAKPTSDKTAANKAAVNTASKTSGDKFLKSLSDYSLDKFRQLSDTEMEKLLPRHTE
mgnify:CR=1 FL=1